MPRLGDKMPRWTVCQLEYVRDHYASVPNEELARRTGKTAKAIVTLAHRFGLRKSPERLIEMGRENVNKRYNK